MEPTSTPDAESGDGGAPAGGVCTDELGALLHGAADLAHELLLLPSGSRAGFLEELHGFMAGLHRRAVQAVAPTAPAADPGAAETGGEQAGAEEADRLLAALAWQLWGVVRTAARVPAVVPPPGGVRPDGRTTAPEGETGADRAPGAAATETTETADAGESTGRPDTGEPVHAAPGQPLGPLPAGREQAERAAAAGPDRAAADPALAAFTSRLAEIAARHPDLRDEPGSGGPADPAGLWLRLHLALLKIPAGKVAGRRSELAEAALLLDGLDDLDGLVEYGPDVLVPALPGVFEEAFVLPLDLPGSGEPAEADRGELLAVLRAAKVPPQEQERVLPWAVRIAQARRLLAVDRTLGGYAEDNVPWSRAQADRLPLAWNDKLSSLSNMRGSAISYVRSAQKLDGTLGRLCHEEPAQRGSWWWEWRSRVSALLEAPAAEANRRAVSPEDVAGWSVAYWSDWCSNNAVHHGHQPKVVLWVLTTPLAPPSGSSEHGRLLLGQSPSSR